MQPFEFLIPKRPVSLQTRNRKNLQDWKSYVQNEARKVWDANTPPISGIALRCQIVYLSGDAPADIDNIIKPIQDALVGLVFEDDFLVSDVDSHRRSIDEPFDIASLPNLLLAGITSGDECVYVQVSEAKTLQDYL